jgi:hypothetical protein
MQFTETRVFQPKRKHAFSFPKATENIGAVAKGFEVSGEIQILTV